MKRKAETISKRPNPGEALKSWKQSHPARAPGSGNSCLKDDFPTLFRDLLMWSPHANIDVFNSTRDFCGSICFSEAIDYNFFEPCLMEHWQDKKETFDERDVAFLHGNGVFFENQVFTDDENCVVTDLPKDQGCKNECSEFASKLCKVWDKRGWMKDWKGVYLVFNKGQHVFDFDPHFGRNISNVLLPANNSAELSVGSHKLMFDCASKFQSCEIPAALQCFLEFK
jgi:hypothetical protein